MNRAERLRAALDKGIKAMGEAKALIAAQAERVKELEDILQAELDEEASLRDTIGDLRKLVAAKEKTYHAMVNHVVELEAETEEYRDNYRSLLNGNELVRFNKRKEKIERLSERIDEMNGSIERLQSALQEQSR